MSRIRPYEWLCLRAIKPRHQRCYSTAETPQSEESISDTRTVPISSIEATGSRAPSPLTPPHVLKFLEKQDTIALKKTHDCILKIQAITARSEKALLDYRHATTTVQLDPSLPPYTNTRAPKSISEIKVAHARSQAKTQNLLDNIWDLQNILYPYEKGPTKAEEFRQRLKGMGEDEKRALSVETKNSLDAAKKRLDQKVGGMEAAVDVMMRIMGKASVGRARGVGSVFERRDTTERCMWSSRPVSKERLMEELKAEMSTKKIGTEDTMLAGPEATSAETVEFETVQSSSFPSTPVDTIGTSKIESEAQDAAAAAAAKPTPPAHPSTYTPTSSTDPETKHQSRTTIFDSAASAYTPLELAEAEAEASSVNTPIQPATPIRDRDPHPATKKTKRSEFRAKIKAAEKSASYGDQMAALKESLMADTQSRSPEEGKKNEGGGGGGGGGTAGYGQSATTIENIREPDEKYPNPFARR